MSITWSTGKRVHLPYSRQTVSRANITGEETVGNDLNLGEFDLSRALSVSEAHLLMSTLVSHRRTAKADVADKEIIINSANYLEEFAKLKDGETIGALERLMSQRPEIEDFEKAQLMSLQPGKADEAKILVPSLGMMLKETPESPKAADVPRLGDEELDFLLNAMSALCNLNQ